MLSYWRTAEAGEAGEVLHRVINHITSPHNVHHFKETPEKKENR